MTYKVKSKTRKLRGFETEIQHIYVQNNDNLLKKRIIILKITANIALNNKISYFFELTKREIAKGQNVIN